MLSAPLKILLDHRITVKSLLHMAIFLFAYLGAYLVRFDGSIPPGYIVPIRHTIMVVLVTKALAFLAFGLFQGWWRYVSMRDVLPIAGGRTVMVTGERRAVVEKLNALVKGYKPMYEFHGDPETPKPGRSQNYHRTGIVMNRSTPPSPPLPALQVRPLTLFPGSSPEPSSLLCK